MINDAISIKQANRMITIQNVTEFPIEIFPSYIQDVIIELYNNSNFNIDYTSAGILVAVATAIGNSFHLERNSEWRESSVLWVANVGKSGQNKSAPVKTAFRAISNKQSDFNKEYKDQLSFYSSDDGNAMPTCKKLFTTDPTFEALVKMHEENPHGIALKPDEFKSFISNLVGYSGGSKQAQHLSMWDGASIYLDRKGTESSMVENPCVSIIGGIQDDVIASLKAKDIKDGFFERILFAIPLKMEKRKNSRTNLNKYIIDEYHNKLSEILNITLEINEPQVVRLSDDANDLFIDEQDRHVEPSNSDGVVSGILSKMDRYMLRFALIIEVLDKLSNNEAVISISKESMQKSILLKEYFYKNALKLNSMILDVFEDNSKEGKALKIIKAINKKEFTNKDFIYVAGKLNIAKESYAYRLLSQTKLAQKVSKGLYETDLLD